jgi:DNA topoisomerase I
MEAKLSMDKPNLMALNNDEETQITRAKIAGIVNNPEKTAKAAQLVYVSDTQKGISRVRRGKKFYYFADNKQIQNKKDLDRIKNLVIPPAWENVWVCLLSNGHLQATGYDLKKRKQYRYHPFWINLRKHTKFYRLLHFGKVLPIIRTQVEKDLALPGMPLEKVLAVAVSLMERTNMRVGNAFYEKLYGSFGLTTLKDTHVNVIGSSVTFSFKGKKGIRHKLSLRSRKLAQIIQQCKEIPGKELFQYIDQDGQSRTIDSGMVNDYIKSISGEEFTTKDFRTWSGTVMALQAFRELETAASDSEIKKNIVQVIDKVSVELGNTRAVCRKYYVHPALISLYENKNLGKYSKSNSNDINNNGKGKLTPEEKALIKILESNLKN